jgi:transcriptional regulator of arginine metabolism
MSNKRDRQRAIEALIDRQPIASQEDLRVHLEQAGWAVTQATLSRDLRELGIVRAHTDDGPRYVMPSRLADEHRPSLEGLLPQLFDSIDGVGELLVLRTLPSGAQPISEAIDSQNWPELLGTIAGENTILLICRSGEARATLTERLLRLAEAG